MTGKLKRRWSKASFRGFPRSETISEGEGLVETRPARVSFRSFRSAGKLGKKMFPPFREETSSEGKRGRSKFPDEPPRLGREPEVGVAVRQNPLTDWTLKEHKERDDDRDP